VEKKIPLPVKNGRINSTNPVYVSLRSVGISVYGVRPIGTVPRTDGFSYFSQPDFLVTDPYVTENFEKNRFF
jgi:hypothetical protein